MTTKAGQIRAETHFQLHSLVQDVLGLGQALDIDGSKKLELTFLIMDHRGQIFQQLCKTCVIAEDEEEGENIKMAALEIILYLVKSEATLGPKLWNIFVQNVLKPNLPFLETVISLEDYNER